MANPTSLLNVTPILRPRQQVEKQLRDAIASGQFARGDKLPGEVDLAESFGVSRATIREALRTLVEAGLIRKVPGMNGGSFVETVDYRTLSEVVSQRMSSVLDLGSITHDEITAFRDMLEVPCAQLAAVNRSDAGLAALHDIIDREKNCKVDDPAVPELNAAFHSALAEATNNRVLAAFVAALHRVARPLAFINTDVNVGAQAVRHHLELFTTIESRDPDAAAAVMRRHLAFLDEHAVVEQNA